MQCVFAIRLFCQAPSPNWASIEMEMNESKQTQAHKVTAVFRHLPAFTPLGEHNYGLSNEEQVLGKFRKPCCSVWNFHINCYGDSESLNPAGVRMKTMYWTIDWTLDTSVPDSLTFRFSWWHFNISAKCVFFFYHDSFEGIFNLLDAGIGKVLVLFFHLHMPVLVVSWHCASPGFYIYAEYPLALVKRKRTLLQVTIYNLRTAVQYHIYCG